MSQPPLQPLPPDSSLSSATLRALDKMSTQELVDSLRPSQPEALRVRPNGTILNGNHRVKLLRERGVDVDSLPREITPRAPKDTLGPPEEQLP